MPSINRNNSRRKTLSPSRVKTFLSGVEVNDDPTNFPDPPESTPRKVLTVRDQNVVTSSSSNRRSAKKRKSVSSSIDKVPADGQLEVFSTDGYFKSYAETTLKISKPDIDVRALSSMYLQASPESQYSRRIAARIFACTGYPLTCNVATDLALLCARGRDLNWSVDPAGDDPNLPSLPVLTSKPKPLLPDSNRTKRTLIMRFKPVLEHMEEDSKAEKETLRHITKLTSKRMPDRTFKYFQDESNGEEVDSSLFVQRYTTHIESVTSAYHQSMELQKLPNSPTIEESEDGNYSMFEQDRTLSEVDEHPELKQDESLAIFLGSADLKCTTPLSPVIQESKESIEKYYQDAIYEAESELWQQWDSALEKYHKKAKIAKDMKEKSLELYK